VTYLVGIQHQAVFYALCYREFWAEVYLLQTQPKLPSTLSKESELAPSIRRDFRLGLIGCGNVGSCIVEGLLSCGMFHPTQITISTRRPELLEHFSSRGIVVVDDNAKVANTCQLVILAVASRHLKNCCPSVRACIDTSSVPGQFWISVLGDIVPEKLQQQLSSLRSVAVVGTALCMQEFEESAAQEASPFVLQKHPNFGDSTLIDRAYFDQAGAMAVRFVAALRDCGLELGLGKETAEYTAIKFAFSSDSVASTVFLPNGGSRAIGNALNDHVRRMLSVSYKPETFYL
jgi:pyrroline-5-carboxylate reductase